MAFANNPRIVSSGTNTAPMELTYQEASGQSFLAGELVYNTNDGLTACASDATRILGQAMEAASGTAATSIRVQVFTPETLIKIRVTNNGTDYLNSGALLDKGKNFGLYVASNVHYLDVNDTTNDAFVVVREPTDATGTATYWCIAKVIPSVCQWATGE